jgi:hypothetical protein
VYRGMLSCVTETGYVLEKSGPIGTAKELGRSAALSGLLKDEA